MLGAGRLPTAAERRKEASSQPGRSGTRKSQSQVEVEVVTEPKLCRLDRQGEHQLLSHSDLDTAVDTMGLTVCRSGLRYAIKGVVADLRSPNGPDQRGCESLLACLEWKFQVPAVLLTSSGSCPQPAWHSFFTPARPGPEVPLADCLLLLYHTDHASPPCAAALRFFGPKELREAQVHLAMDRACYDAPESDSSSYSPCSPR